MAVLLSHALLLGCLLGAGAVTAAARLPLPLPRAGQPSPWGPYLPRWAPTWDLRNSTILYACNYTGMHDVEVALQYGVVVYDWSNGRELWANARPMNDEELLTEQAEMVLARDPGVPGGQPRVWVYRETIQALNFFTSVREKLDDDGFAGWFYRFKDYKGRASNNSYHVPACDLDKCSGFYHAPEHTPQYPVGGPAQGSCREKCDCGKNPCAQYVFDFRNASFQDWFVDHYIINSATILHQPVAIGVGWLDDDMTMAGPTELDPNFLVDTGLTEAETEDSVVAFNKTMTRMFDKLVGMGGWAWQLADEHWHLVRKTPPDECAATLRQWCVPDPPFWNRAHFYRVSSDQVTQNATDFTAEFLLTRGPYAWLGFGWEGCFPTQKVPRRPELWDLDYGVPQGPCAEVGSTGVFQRNYSRARVTWGCPRGVGEITLFDEIDAPTSIDNGFLQ